MKVGIYPGSVLQDRVPVKEKLRVFFSEHKIELDS